MQDPQACPRIGTIIIDCKNRGLKARESSEHTTLITLQYLPGLVIDPVAGACEACEAW